MTTFDKCIYCGLTWNQHSWADRRCPLNETQWRNTSYVASGSSYANEILSSLGEQREKEINELKADIAEIKRKLEELNKVSEENTEKVEQNEEEEDFYIKPIPYFEELGFQGLRAVEQPRWISMSEKRPTLEDGFGRVNQILVQDYKGNVTAEWVYIVNKNKTLYTYWAKIIPPY